MGDIAFVVRSLPGTSLKGAFRVHLSPEGLTHLGLKVGDLCTIIGEDGSRGPAIAWRATDKMGNNPKIQPAKMTETLRDACGIKQGIQVRIEKARITSIRPAARITLTEILPTQDPDDGCWKSRCVGTLISCEAFATGTSFEINAGEGIKKRYYIEQIDFDGINDGAPALACLSDATEIHMVEDNTRSPSPLRKEFQLTTARIGGLNAQVEELNNRIRALCLKARMANVPLGSWNTSILLHGYSGTGKTLMMSEIARCHGLSKIVRLEQHQLLGTPSKNHATIHAVFKDASTNPPSLILVDDIDKIVPANDTTTSSTAAAFDAAFDSISDKEVMVIATATSVTGMEHTLLRRLVKCIELPIPEMSSREQILKVVSPTDHATTETLRAVAGVTHGFTGSDLGRLFDEALSTASIRWYLDHANWIHVDPVADTRPTTALTDERRSSVASTLIERPPHAVQLTLADFEAALKVVRPSALQEVIIEPPKISFADIGGSKALQARFERLIKWPMDKPDLYMANPNYKPKRGILLYGPPGCSKTMTAQAVASTFGLNFIAVKGSELISMYVGESERAIREIFRKARQAAPTIIFFDEIDSIATARSDVGSSSTGLNVVTTLLNEMDGFEAMKNVVVLAATNKPASLDPAILRAGRFDEHFYLGPPNDDARREIMRLCIAGPAESEVEAEPLIIETEGMSGAEIKNAWNTAWETAIEDSIVSGQQLKVTTEMFRSAISRTPRAITAAMLQTYADFAARRLK